MNQREERFIRVIPELSELPAAFRTGLADTVKLENLERIILVPKQEYPFLRTILSFQLPFGWRSVPQKVVLAYRDALELYSLLPNGNLESIRIEEDQILHLGIGSHLLYAFADLSWYNTEGYQTARIEFNAVGETILRERLDVIRTRISKSGDVRTSPPEVEEALKDRTIPIKFRNYAVFSLLPGEQIQCVVYQPAIRKNRLLSMPVAPSRLFTLTDRHIIVFDEDSSVAANYSINTVFYPLINLSKVQYREGPEHDEIVFTFRKFGVENPVIYPVQKERADDIKRFAAAFSEAELTLAV